MIKSRRIERVNSLLREVITEVIQRDVKNPKLPQFLSVTNIEVTHDLQHAKVYITLLGDNQKEAIAVLNAAAGFIAARAAKKVTMRYFPELTFHIDESVEAQIKVHTILTNIENERNQRQ